MAHQLGSKLRDFPANGIRTFISRTVVIRFNMVSQVRRDFRLVIAISTTPVIFVDLNHVPLHLGVDLRMHESSPFTRADGVSVCKNNGGGLGLRSTLFGFNNADTTDTGSVS